MVGVQRLALGMLFQVLVEEPGPREDFAALRALTAGLGSLGARSVGGPHVLVETLLVTVRSTANGANAVAAVRLFVAAQVVARREPDPTDLAFEGLFVARFTGQHVLLKQVTGPETSGASVASVRPLVAVDVVAQIDAGRERGTTQVAQIRAGPVAVHGIDVLDERRRLAERLATHVADARAVSDV